MKRIQAHLSLAQRLSVVLALVALAGVAAVMSSPFADLASKSLRQNDIQLADISSRAQQLRLISKHLHNVAHVTDQTIDLPFAGLVGGLEKVLPGARLKLGGRYSDGRYVEVVSAERIAPNLGLKVRASPSIELVIVTARPFNSADQSVVRFLAAVAEPKPQSSVEPRSL